MLENLERGTGLKLRIINLHMSKLLDAYRQICISKKFSYSKGLALHVSPTTEVILSGRVMMGKSFLDWQYVVILALSSICTHFAVVHTSRLWQMSRIMEPNLPKIYHILCAQYQTQRQRNHLCQKCWHW